MIFNNNPTMSAIPMAEGYDCSTGCAMALIESARSDYAMFEAMLKVEARAVQYESAGYVNEGEYMALQEATAANIWNKIKELFSKLIAKVKAIFTSFSSKIYGLFAKDKALVKKYRTAVLSKSNIGKLEIKNFRKVIKSPVGGAEVLDKRATLSSLVDKWEDESGKRVNAFLADIVPGAEKDDFEEKYIKTFFNDATDMKISEIGLTTVVNYLENGEKVRADINSKSKKLVESLSKLVRDANTNSTEKANGKPLNDAELTTANKTYDCAVSYQDAMLTVNRVYMNAVKLEYKQYKSVFMKAIAANNDKLKESTEYSDAIASVAEAEVTDVLDKAISGETLSDVNVASKSVIDSDVSDDPDYLTYGDDCYTTHPQKKTVDGSVDTEINSKDEAAFFGELLY